MKLGLVFGLGAAVVLHLLVIAFGGILFLHDEKNLASLQQVELLSADDAAEKEKPKDEPKEAPKDEIQAQEEAPPDASEIVKSLEIAPVNSAPALDAASLSAIEAALSGQGGGGDFGAAANLASGGIIGGSGSGSLGEASLEQAFNPADIDQKPQIVSQPSPSFPPEMRGKRIEGVVTLIFIVDPTGRVSDPRVETSTNPAYDRPALDAVRRWKFEPALRKGERVPWKMRTQVRFPSS